MLSFPRRLCDCCPWPLEGHPRRTGHEGSLCREPIVECSSLTASGHCALDLLQHSLQEHTSSGLLPANDWTHWGSRAGPFLSRGGFLRWELVAWGSPSGWPKLSQNCAVVWNSSYSTFPSLFAFTGLRLASWAEGSPYILLLLPTSFLHRHFPR